MVEGQCTLLASIDPRVQSIENESLKIFYICIPEKPHKKIDELIDQLQKIQ